VLSPLQDSLVLSAGIDALLETPSPLETQSYANDNTQSGSSRRHKYTKARDHRKHPIRGFVAAKRELPGPDSG
jgi:hypothetical protein